MDNRAWTNVNAILHSRNLGLVNPFHKMSIAALRRDGKGCSNQDRIRFDLFTVCACIRGWASRWHQGSDLATKLGDRIYDPIH